MEKQNTKNLFTSLLAGIALTFSVLLPAQAALVQADVMGQIDSFGLGWDAFEGLAVGDTVQMHVVWDDTGVSGAASETVGFESMTIDFFNAANVSVMTFTPENTAADTFNVLLFENGDLMDMDIFTFIDDGTLNIDYEQFIGDGFFTVIDFLSGEMVLDGSYTLPLPPGSITPVAVVPVPAAVWLFGAGLAGLVGIARRKPA